MIYLKRFYKYIMLLIPLTIIYRPFLFFGNHFLEESVGSVFLSNLYGGSYSKERIDIVVSVLGLYGVLTINIIFGDYISKDFYTNSEYIFVRVRKKSRWYLEKTFQLFLYCCLGTFIYIAMFTAGSLWKSVFPTNGEDIMVILGSYIMLSLFSYLTTLLINLLSILHGTSFGFLMSYSFIILSDMFALLLQNIRQNRIVRIIHLLNPLSNLTISWNLSTGNVVWGIIYFFILNILFAITGSYIVKKQEIGLLQPDK